ncbi:MAG: lysophospholipid acyltransferase family protein [Fibrobacterota bacterium]
MISGIIRFPLIWSTIILYIAVSLTVRIFVFRKRARLRCYTKITSFFCRIGLAVLGVRLMEKRQSDAYRQQNFLIVSNHLSYIDILVYSSLKPMLFISSTDVQKMPFLGLMSTLGGTVFVERRKISGIKRDIEKISEILSDGFNICLFPEATSGDGSDVLPFKTALLGTAGKAGKKILPACIRYTHIGKEEASPENRDKVCYYGDMNFFPHFLRLIFSGGAKAEPEFFSPIDSAGLDRREIGDRLYGLIRNAYIRK